jgi:hypothetical protein
MIPRSTDGPRWMQFFLIKITINNAKLPTEISLGNLAVCEQLFSHKMVKHQVFDSVNVNKDFKHIAMHELFESCDINLCIPPRVSLMLGKGQEHHLGNTRQVLTGDLALEHPLVRTLFSVFFHMPDNGLIT